MPKDTQVPKPAPRTSLVFRDEDQRKKFSISIIETGMEQNEVVQAMVDIFTADTKGFLAVVDRARVNKSLAEKKK